ncbi:retron St85 family RNA-directed DNA polymerase [Acinetobacter guillouiae]|jgi:retron-type reverse transcriptase|uniref:retron St85 family RNA-directed DNA polymerase n=1 Tax=Acinetobacter guillouiae TaxID=106649 RepID=UPI003AF5A8E4
MSRVEILEKLKINFNKSHKELFLFFHDAPRKYKVYSIPKRTSGTRTIAQPIPELKDYQRFIVSIFKEHLPVHECCMAYVDGRNIKKNAQVHSKNSFFLKMDFMEFFNSITPKLFWEACERQQIEFDWVDKEILEKILFWKPSKYSNKLVLSIGGPSSPFISNFLMYSFDNELNEYCKKNGITYTRYADDLTFSTKVAGILFDIPDLVRKVLLKFYGREIHVNQFKTVFSSKKHNRHVTGLTVANDSSISIGRAKKRYIKHLVHTFIEKKIKIEDLNYLKGYLGFIQHVEPKFLHSLEQKYTKALIQEIRLER